MNTTDLLPLADVVALTGTLPIHRTLDDARCDRENGDRREKGMQSALIRSSRR